MLKSFCVESCIHGIAKILTIGPQMTIAGPRCFAAYGRNSDSFTHSLSFIEPVPSTDESLLQTRPRPKEAGFRRKSVLRKDKQSAWAPYIHFKGSARVSLGL